MSIADIRALRASNRCRELMLLLFRSRFALFFFAVVLVELGLKLSAGNGEKALG